MLMKAIGMFTVCAPVRHVSDGVRGLGQGLWRCADRSVLVTGVLEIYYPMMCTI